MRYLLLLFVVVPLGELYLLLWVSRLIGFWSTVGITLFTGILGSTLAKREGLRVWRAWSRALDEMRAPEEGVIDGLLVLVGGVLLVTPGILTDIVGFLLLVPASRRPVAQRVRQAVDRRLAMQTFHASVGTPAPHLRAPDIIDTAGERISDREP